MSKNSADFAAAWIQNMSMYRTYGEKPIQRAIEAYVKGRIDIDELERRIWIALGGDP